MSKSGSIAQIAESLYEAALQPERWRMALNEANDFIGADGACLLCWPGIKPDAVWSERLDDLATVFIEEGWNKRNLRLTRAVALRHTRRVMRESDLFTREELDKLPFNAEFINKQGYRWVAGMFIAEGPGAMTAFAVERKAKAEPFERSDIDRIEALYPHLRRAGEIAGRMGEAKGAGMLETFEQLGCAAILLDFTGRAQRMNQRARRYVGQAIQMFHGQLVTAHRDANAAFQSLIGDILQPTASSLQPPVLAPVPRPDGRPLIAYGMPVSRSAADIFHHSKALLVLIDPDENHSPNELVLRHGFKLTPAECRLTLALGEGATVSEFAARQGITVGTARIQLKAVMAKTATRRQSELVALLARLSRAHAN